MIRTVKLRKGLHIDGESLLCINGCGFYGNPLWSGYCSICYKERKQAINSITRRLDSTNQSISEDVNNISSSDSNGLSTPNPESPSPLSKFEKFEEKKRQQTEKRSKTLKNIFKKASFRENVSSISLGSGNKKFPIPSFTSSSSLGFGVKPNGFNYDTLTISGDSEENDNHKQSTEILNDIQKHVQKFCSKITKLGQSSSTTIEKLSDEVQDFYKQMSQRFEQDAFYTAFNLSNEQLDQLSDLTEQQLLSKLHHLFFARIQAEGEEKDLKMQKRIRSLNWITAQHLDAEINFQNSKVQSLYDQAISDLIEMGSKQVPLEKLNCIVNCSNTILNLIKISRNEVASADQFLPALVYILIKANPPLLHSNVQFITLFAIPTRLHSGETGYFFTNMCCAVTFIENLSGESLNLTEEQFNLYMSGEAVPPEGVEEAVVLSEPLRIMYANQASLNDLLEKKCRIDLDLEEANQKLHTLQESAKARLKPLIENGHKVTAYDVDDQIKLDLIPSVLRNRIADQRKQKENTLIDLDEPIATASNPMEATVAAFASSTSSFGFEDNFVDQHPVQSYLVDLKAEDSLLHEPIKPEIVRK